MFIGDKVVSCSFIVIIMKVENINVIRCMNIIAC